VHTKEVDLKPLWCRNMDVVRSYRNFITSCMKMLYGYRLKQSRYALLNLLREINVVYTDKKCPFCGFKGVSIIKHMSSAHRADMVVICRDLWNIYKFFEQYINAYKTARRWMYRCLICGKKFYDKRNIYAHLILDHFPDKICREYGYIFDCSKLASSRGL